MMDMVKDEGGLGLRWILSKMKRRTGFKMDMDKVEEEDWD